MSTCHSSGGRQLYNQDFDVVIIDEATQALEAVSHSFSILISRIKNSRSAGSQYSKAKS